MTSPNDGATPLFEVARMQVVCGTDFSRSATQATDVAAAFAARLKESLALVHVVESSTRAQLPGELRESLSSYGADRLHEEAQRLRANEVLHISEVFRSGEPSEVLAAEANRPESRLLVVAASGADGSERPALGGIAERASLACQAPALLVRSASPLVGWLAGKRALHVFLEADFSVASDAALGWIQWLQTLGPCDVTVAYMEQGPIAPDAAATASPSAAAMLARTVDLQTRCFRQRVRKVLGERRVRIRVERGWRHSDAHLIQMAAEERADLLVLGIPSGEHGGLGDPNPVKGVVHYAPMNIACVPAVASLARM